MHAIVVFKHGGPEVLEYSEVKDPEPGIGELLVRPLRIGVNYIDTYYREGIYSRETPYIPGDEGAGVVVGVGTGVSEFAPGDRVAWSSAPSSYAQYVCVPAARAVPVPDSLPDEIAASALFQGMTAHYLVNDTHRAKEGDFVLVHAGAGGVGQLLIQMCVQQGLRVIATASTPEKVAIAKSRGAEIVLSYEEATGTTIRRLTDGGVETVFDGVGAATFDSSLDSLRVRGTFVLYGAASGPVPPFDLQRLNSGGALSITRPSLAYFVRNREELLERSGAVLSALESGDLELEVGATFPLSQAAEAHRALEGRKTQGSIVLDPLS
ncbi:quinone oxidoreductase family protein [Dietzia sp.]|uniref:quinone oxidoreductase family protein n=1 Tax=Dietzia sp. TaxID=1871616 RepID=UPI002FDAFB7D